MGTGCSRRDPRVPLRNLTYSCSVSALLLLCGLRSGCGHSAVCEPAVLAERGWKGLRPPRSTVLGLALLSVLCTTFLLPE